MSNIISGTILSPKADPRPKTAIRLIISKSYGKFRVKDNLKVIKNPVRIEDRV